MQPTTDLPPITAREVSYHEALAGIEAREAAQASGGDAAALRALVHAAETTSPPSSFGIPHSSFLKGLPLRSDDLLVTLCFGLHARAFGTDPRAQWAADETATRMEAIAVLGYLFTQAGDAFTLLDQAVHGPEDQRETFKTCFRRAAIEWAATFTGEDIAVLTRHLLKLAGFAPAEEEAAPPAAGEPQAPPPSPPARSWWHRLARLVAGFWPTWTPSSAPTPTSPSPPPSASRSVPA